MAAKSKIDKDKAPEKQRPDDGQGSKGEFGSDGDWGKPQKKSDKDSSPIPVKKADE
jgi:hypothetical protein